MNSKELKWEPFMTTGSVNYLPVSVEITSRVQERDVLATIGNVAGECYGSSKDTDKCINRALNCIKRGHHSPFEHINLQVRCVIDRGTSHAVVRHRHCAFQQSSTIYQKYADGINIIALPDYDPCTGKEVPAITEHEKQYYEEAAALYKKLLNDDCDPARARDVLPNALATTLIITANLRELVYITKRRMGPGDAVRMHVFAKTLDEALREMLPDTMSAFDEWYESHPL